MPSSAEDVRQCYFLCLFLDELLFFAEVAVSPLFFAVPVAFLDVFFLLAEVFVATFFFFGFGLGFGLVHLRIIPPSGGTLTTIDCSLPFQGSMLASAGSVLITPEPP